MEGGQRRAMPRIAGHHEGMQVVKKITKFASKLNVESINSLCFFQLRTGKDQKRKLII